MTDIKTHQVTERGTAFNRFGPWMGIAFFVFVAASVATGNTPQANASGAKVVEYYTKHRDLTTFSLSVDLLGAVCGAFFFGYLYAWLRRTDRTWMPVVALMGATLFITAGLLAGGADFMLVDQGRYLTPDAAKAVNVVGEDLWTLVGSGAIGIAALATGVSLLAHRAASKWWAVAAIATGILAIVGWFTPFGLILELIWVLAFSIRLVRRAESVSLSGMESTASRIPTIDI
jgi:hypothetical protein